MPAITGRHKQEALIGGKAIIAVYARAARNEDEPLALAKLGLIKDEGGLTQVLRVRSWLAGSLAGLGGALDMANLTRDPFDKLLSWGLTWVIEHFSPLKDWFNDLTGNPGKVRAFSQTWSSIGDNLDENSAVPARAVNEDIDGVEGVTVAACRSHQTDMPQHIGMVGGLSEGMAMSLLGVSVAVQTVRDLVRDRISGTVSSLVKYMVMEFLSLDALTPFIIEDVAGQVLHSITVLRGHIKDLFHSGRAFGQLADGVKNVLTKFKNVLANHSDAGVRRAVGQADDAAPALANIPGRGKSFNPPPPKPLVPDDSVGHQALHNGDRRGNGAYADYYFDRKGNFLGVETVHSGRNVAHHRLGGSTDVAERKLYRDMNKGSVSPLKDPVTGQIYRCQADRRVNSHLIDPTRHRILNSEYDLATVFGGKRANTAPHVEQIRQPIADPSGPAHDWESAYKQLGPDGRGIVNKLEVEETNLDLTSHEKHMNHPGLHQRYECSITRDLPEDSWVHTYMQGTGSIHGWPGTVVTHAGSIASKGLKELYFLRSFSNVKRGLGTIQ